MGFEVPDTSKRMGRVLAPELVRNQIRRPSQVRLPVVLHVLKIRTSTDLNQGGDTVKLSKKKKKPLNRGQNVGTDKEKAVDTTLIRYSIEHENV